MHIKEIAIRNFRILSDSKLELDKKPCLMIGRNNAGKTSFMVLVEKFLKGQSFTFNDFPVHLRETLLNMDINTDVSELAIQLMLTIEYDAKDDLSVLSEFIVDLEPGRPEVYLLFESRIDQRNLFAALGREEGVDRQKFIRRHLGAHMKPEVYTFDDSAVLENDPKKMARIDRKKLVKKQLSDVTKLIDFEIIHAKRSVASSEEHNGRKVLSRLTTSYFNAQNPGGDKNFTRINELIAKTDRQLDAKYDKFFERFLENAKDFLDIGTLKVQSNLSAKEILEDASEVVYGEEDTQLPEYQNGLGHVNILYLLLSIQMKVKSFEENKKQIRLLFIEEPEAHTHPQLQYNFARKISGLAGEKQGIQTIITTHSPQIVASHPFENLRYMAAVQAENGGRNIEIKHFHRELKKSYADEAEFKFLRQYLTIVSAELFFADKAIFIEGTSEVFMLPYFISRFDEEQRKKLTGAKKDNYIPLAAQNIAIVEAGANAKAFRHFIEFLGIPTLIITDLDAVHRVKENGKTKYRACNVMADDVCSTSNATIKYYFDAPDIKTDPEGHKDWFLRLRERNVECISKQTLVAFQCEENGFHPRSFEDAFVNANLDKMFQHRKSINGLQNLSLFEKYMKKDPQVCGELKDLFGLTAKILGEKSGLASSLLYLTYAKDVKWETPRYIREGLEWLYDQKH